MRARVPRHGVILLGFSLLSFTVSAKEPALSSNDDLSVAALSAAEAIGKHQKPDGYWLTSHTPAARFEDAKVEMNTYLTSVMADLLGPAAESTGLHAGV